jgi:signal transduction histidine kinase
MSKMSPVNGTIENIADAMWRDHVSKAGARRIGQTVLLVGAGCSRSAGVPLAREIAQELTVRLATSYGLVEPTCEDPLRACDALIGAKKFPISARLENPNSKDDPFDWNALYDHIFTDHYATPKEVQPLFAEFCDRAGGKINWANVCIGELVRLGFISTIITTNFDQLVLEGIARAGRLPVVADGLGSLNRVAGEPTHPQLIQIHGSRHTYYLRNSAADLKKVAEDDGARHAIEELIRGAKIFVVVGYGGRERSVMDFLISAGKRWPDTQIFWVQHSEEIGDLSNLAREFLQTSDHGKIVPGQDADSFFMRLCQLLGIGAPRAIIDPLGHLHDLNDQIISSSDPDISNVIAENRKLLAEFEYYISIRKSKASSTADIIAKASELRLSGRFEEELDLLLNALELGGDATLKERFQNLLSSGVIARLQSADNSPLPSAVVDRLGSILYSNDLFFEFIRQNKISRAFQNISDIVDAEERDRLLEVIRSISEDGRSHWMDLALKSSDLLVRFYFKGISNVQSEARCQIYIADITTQRNMEKQLAEGQKMQAIGQLTVGIAHDFNNILSAIGMANDFLLNAHKPTDPSFQDIMQIKQSVTRAGSLVRQLLAFSRRQTLRPQILDVGDAISDLTMLLRRLIGEKVRLDVVHGRDLWRVKVDISQFEQVIVNLAVNARDAMPDGGTLMVRTTNVLSEEVGLLLHKNMLVDDYVLVEVGDTGTGIPPDLIDKIFEPFFSTKEVGKGTGLGLSTVYGIVRQSGGYIYVKSEPMRGAVFEIFLPRTKESVVPRVLNEPMFLSPPPSLTARDTFDEGTILLVEDEDGLRSLNARGLRSRGYSVIEASDGLEALDALSRAGSSVDLVVSNVVMPNMDGPTLLKAMRERNLSLRVVFVSGYAAEIFERSLPENEEILFLPKPFSLAQLVSLIRQAMAH